MRVLTILVVCALSVFCGCVSREERCSRRADGVAAEYRQATYDRCLENSYKRTPIYTPPAK